MITPPDQLPARDRLKVFHDVLVMGAKAAKFTWQETLSALLGITATTCRLTAVPLHIAVACFIEHYNSQTAHSEKVVSRQEFDA